VLAAAIGCTTNGANNGFKPVIDPNPPGDDDNGGLPPPRQPDQMNEGGSLGVGNRGNDGSAPKPEGGRSDPPDGSMPVNAPDSGGVPEASPQPQEAGDDTGTSSEAGAPDATTTNDSGTDSGGTGSDSGVLGPPDACAWPLGAGDVAIVELMIVSQQGASDQGEWFEVQSTRQCSVNLKGLHVVSQGAVDGNVFTLDVANDLWIPPNGFVVVADSTDPSLNHSLPGTLLVWSGDSPTNSLDDAGGQLTLTVGQTTVDSLPYPAFLLYYGVSISFPADCSWSDRSSWARWSYSFNQWTPGFAGTPNTDNTDVTCY
jgi:hypothetical protein